MKMHYVTTVLVNNEPIGFRRTFAFQTPHAQLKSAPGAREGARALSGLRAHPPCFLAGLGMP